MTQFSPPDAYRNLKNVYIPHKAFVTMFDCVKKRIDGSMSGMALPCLHVAGYTGIGKSVLVTKLKRQYPHVPDASVTRLEDGTALRAARIPLIAIKVGSSPTVTSIFKRILKEFGDPYHDRGTVNDLEERISRYVAACGTKVIVIDEAQRIVDMNGLVTRQAVGFFLQNIHDESGVLIVLLGLGRARFLFEQDKQIARRFDSSLQFNPYQWEINESGKDDGNSGRATPAKTSPHPEGSDLSKRKIVHTFGREDFLSVVAVYRRVMGVNWSTELVEDKFYGERFYYASQGVIGYLEKLFLKAVELLMDDDDPVVTLNLLHSAFGLAFDPSEHNHLAVNPFSPSYDGRMPPELPDHNSLIRPPKSLAKQRAGNAGTDLDKVLKRKR